MNRKIITRLSLLTICSIFVLGSYFVSQKTNIDGEVKTDATKSNTIADADTSKMLNEVAEEQAKVEQESDKVQVTLQEAKDMGYITIDITELTEEVTKFDKANLPLVWAEPIETETQKGILYDLTLRNNNEMLVTTNNHQQEYKMENGEIKVMYAPPMLLLSNSKTKDKVVYMRTSSYENNIQYNDDGTIGYMYLTDEDFNYNDYDTISLGQYKWAEFPISEFIK